jgi:hypothetical protein
VKVIAINVPVIRMGRKLKRIQESMMERNVQQFEGYETGQTDDVYFHGLDVKSKDLPKGNSH